MSPPLPLRDTLAADCTVLQVNLTATRLVGIERSRLVGQLFGVLVASELRPSLHAFLDQVLASQTKQAGDFVLLNPGQPPRAVSIEAQRSASGRECRVAVMDITARDAKACLGIPGPDADALVVEVR